MVIQRCIWCNKGAYGVTKVHMVLQRCIWCYKGAYGVTKVHMVLQRYISRLSLNILLKACKST